MLFKRSSPRVNKVQMIRIGGNGVEFNLPSGPEYVDLIDSIRRIGAEPMVHSPTAPASLSPTRPSSTSAKPKRWKDTLIYLSSDASRFVTGETVLLDGGFNAYNGI